VAQAPQFDTPETLSQQIIAALSARKEYPAAALRRKTEGVVKLSLVVAPDGSLIKASIQSPSGSSVLDEAAMRLVQGIFPLKVRLASAVSLVVPVEYRIPK
jgi:TonB family protein